MTSCEDIQKLIPDLLTGDLPPQDHQVVQDHLAECSACRDEITGLSETWAQLGVLPDPKASPALREGFYAMLSRESGQADVDATLALRRVRKPKPYLPWVVSTAATLLVAVGAFTLGRWAQSGNPPQMAYPGVATSADLAMLQSPSVGDRMVGITLIAQNGNGDPSLAGPLLDLLDHDPNVRVRLAAVEALYFFDHQPEVRSRVAAALNQQTSPLVQMALIDLLVGMREKRAHEALQALIQDHRIQPEVREKAEASLAKARIGNL